MLIGDIFFVKSLPGTRQMSYSIYKGGSICKVDMVNLCQFPWKPKFIVKWKVHNESKMLKLKVISIRVLNQQRQ